MNEEKSVCHCPQCGVDISHTEFSTDSEVRGVIDIGYDCENCEITVYIYKVVKQRGGHDDTQEGHSN